ncbi:MAG: hypothetical protein KGK18_17855, partial [Burkholderiales bacterium]|nr:hypothetical protein [Burkholderiales bacterium]
RAAKAPASQPAPTRPAAHQTRTSALEHELQVHRVELEMQNEELRRAQLELAAARDRYVDLYDFAPVAYLTIAGDDAVVEANLTAAALLEEPRAALLQHRFARFVCAADADRWHRLRQWALQQQGAQRIELTLQPRSGAVLYGQLDCVRVAPAGTAPTLRVTLIDITQRKHAEIDRSVAATLLETREAERRRVARELHEELGQRLSALKMGLTSLRPRSPQSRQAERIDEMLETLDESMASVRRIAAELRPSMLDDLGLNAAIDWLVRDCAQRLGLAIALRVPDVDPPLDERRTTALYRLLQETLAYLARHASGAEIDVELQLLRHELVLTVRSHGAIAPRSADRRGAGAALQTLYQHAHLLGGRLVIEPDASGGERHTLRLPLADAARAPETRASRPRP